MKEYCNLDVTKFESEDTKNKLGDFIQALSSSDYQNKKEPLTDLADVINAYHELRESTSHLSEHAKNLEYKIKTQEFHDKKNAYIEKHCLNMPPLVFKKVVQFMAALAGSLICISPTFTWKWVGGKMNNLMASSENKSFILIKELEKSVPPLEFNRPGLG